MPYSKQEIYYIEGEWGGKVCTECKQFRYWSEFSKQKRGLQGYASQCKNCMRIKQGYTPKIIYIKNKHGRECTICGKFKSWTYFGNNKRGYNNKQSCCTECMEKRRKNNDSRRKDKIRKYNKKYKEDHKDKLLIDGRNYQKEYCIRQAIYTTYINNLTIEESPRETEDGFLEVKCANSECRKYFTPTNDEVSRRIRALKGQLPGEQRLYCSEKCKQECSLYWQQKTPKGFKPETLDTEFPAFIKEEIFKRDKYRCQICGRTHDLQAHHEFPGSTHHMLSKDVKNGITLCKECHIKVHMLPGCSFSEIASCSQSIKKELQEKGINLNEVPEWALDKYLKK